MPVAVKKQSLEFIDKNHQNYCDLVTFFLNADISIQEKERKASHFLKKEIQSLTYNSNDFPADMSKIQDWMLNNNKVQCTEYQAYLERRNSGAGREYFKNVAQAFEFLIKVAPVKRVDGSWLFSIIHYWNDPVFRDLIQIYLEELGLGLAKSNHVCLFDDLILNLGLEHFVLDLEDEYYHQPAIQLALAYAPPEFIPEIIGFNLAYEQLPLHLLITNYELQELGIDSKYFNLHITIDNIDNGHAHLSHKAFEKIYRKFNDKEFFIEKMKIGFALSNKGLSSIQIIKNLNLDTLVIKILKRKALVGNVIHNDKCKFNNQTINSWLAVPDSVEEFIDVLIDKKWIKLGRDPEESRFWRLISQEDGKMYGVFNSTEKQIIYDWIAGEYAQYTDLRTPGIQLEHKNQNDFMFSFLSDGELEDIQHQIYETGNLAMKINKLLPYLAPHAHHRETGLWCTQRFVDFLFPFLSHQKFTS
ncbi:iron-containing redox enzyme family protein [Acinetobacter sp. BSP-28]|uniref:iron-containing redox enzyme family protein n=1 Tax=Acinetobacter sp. BSP-28 TaxID=3344661 RepID=UPI00376FD604